MDDKSITSWSDESKYGVLDVMNKINNVYGLTLYEISEFRNLLLKKLTLRELKGLLAVADGSSNEVEDLSAIFKKKAKSMKPTERTNYKLKVNKRQKATNQVLAAEAEVIYFGSLLIGRLKLIPLFPVANVLSICQKTMRLFYDIQYYQGSDWYKSVISVSLHDVISFSRNGPSIILKLSAGGVPEVSYKNGQSYFPDVTYKDIQTARVHQIEFMDTNNLFSMQIILKRLINNSRNSNSVSSLDGSAMSRDSNIKTADLSCTASSNSSHTAITSKNISDQLGMKHVPNIGSLQTWDNPITSKPSMMTLPYSSSSSYRNANAIHAFNDSQDSDTITNNQYSMNPLLSYTQDNIFNKSFEISPSSNESPYFFNSLQGNPVYLSDPFIPYINQTFNFFEGYQQQQQQQQQVCNDNIPIDVTSTTDGTVTNSNSFENISSVTNSNHDLLDSNIWLPWGADIKPSTAF
ncbi:unnamed protein product [Auanema sp. JU1783]|nr:unnamed protein product [Auanema sp. JU1783]